MAAADSPKREGISVLTLAIAAASSVAAAVVVSRFWKDGTLWATAMTPVIVTVVKEMLERPAQKITEVSAKVPLRRGEHDAIVVEEVEPAPEDPARTPYKRYAPRRRHFKLALGTGLLAFVIAALVLTVPELVAGESVTGGGRNTTIFGGGSDRESDRDRGRTTTTDSQQETAPADEQQETTPPEETTPEEAVPPAETAPTTPEEGGTPAPEEPVPTAPPPTPPPEQPAP
jgi:hypothetical protein